MSIVWLVSITNAIVFHPARASLEPLGRLKLLPTTKNALRYIIDAFQLLPLSQIRFYTFSYHRSLFFSHLKFLRRVFCFPFPPPCLLPSTSLLLNLTTIHLHHHITSLNTNTWSSPPPQQLFTPIRPHTIPTRPTRSKNVLATTRAVIYEASRLCTSSLLRLEHLRMIAQRDIALFHNLCGTLPR